MQTPDSGAPKIAKKEAVVSPQERWSFFKDVCLPEAIAEVKGKFQTRGMEKIWEVIADELVLNIEEIIQVVNENNEEYYSRHADQASIQNSLRALAYDYINEQILNLNKHLETIPSELGVDKKTGAPSLYALSRSGGKF